MTWYNLIFFHVFKRYYKNGRYGNDIPWLTASGIVGVSSQLYLFTFTALVYFYTYGEMPELEKKYLLSLGFVFVALNWLWFIGGNRYLKIFDNFKERYLRDKFTETLSWVYVLGAYVAFILMVLTLKM
ncbi:hypothetical protein MKJ04_19850 [Pontibacter sp. E15-1]|uniref:hypothetical protein n=1 Tax=Pontibacter sp. E15-1 TaxID=2919918 RepID=UPI001F500A41|nr:hypothetical protein [Pontibacter sp. E15-1]MCJ8167106.1 hypothetical protein [Pontibacter sp. E15-1]